jgi:hypothetical protein
LLSELDEKNVDISPVVKKALHDRQVLAGLLNGLMSKKETFRYNCSRTLERISEEHGKALYPHWDYFVDLLSSDNTYHKISALNILAHLVKDDTDRRFIEVFERYYQLLDDRSMITATYVARYSARIVKAKPELENIITGRLLNIDKTHHDPERKDLIKGYTLESFSDYFETANNKRGILEFAREQLHSKSPKTKKIAKAFLEKWDRQHS